MKRIALLAAVVLFAACAPKAEEAPATEMAAPAADSAAMTMDSTMTDSTAPAATDSAAKPM
jgi:uncharacterized lipoprotein YajG